MPERVSDADLAALEIQYTPEPMPPCPECGAMLAIIPGHGTVPSVWACPRAAPGTDHHALGHFIQRRFNQRQRGDARVLAAVAETRRLRAELANSHQEMPEGLR